MINRALAPAFFAVFLSAAPLAHAGMTLGSKPRVAFDAEGSPGFLTFEGVTNQITLTEQDDKLVFTVPMDTVDTGISLRDDHMRRNYVHTDKFPNAVLALPKADITWPESGSSEGSVKGSFEVHGVSLEVTVTYDIKRTKDGYKVKASFPFNTEKHGIEIPVYLGVTIQPDMTANVNLVLIDG